MDGDLIEDIIGGKAPDFKWRGKVEKHWGNRIGNEKESEVSEAC